MKDSSLSLLTSWPLDLGIGSGVGVVVESIHKVLAEAGWEVTLLSPSFSSCGYITSSFQRVMFNLSIRSSEVLKNGPVVAFDFDGFYLSRDVRYASVNGGILGDIVRFESGLIRQVLKALVMLEKVACRKADVIFTPSRFAKGKVCSLYGISEGKVKVMPNGIFFDSWVGEVESAEPETKRPPTVLSVARLYKRKGLDQLIRVWPDILREKPAAILRIVGDGIEKKSLKNLAERMGLEGFVRFEGEISDRGVLAHFYANCDLFCLPSRHETFGLVFLEAMAAGKPVVALDSTAVSEVVRNGVEGILVKTEDDTALVRAVVSLLNNPFLRRKMGDDGRERVKNNFDWPKVIGPLINWLEESKC